MHSAQSLHTAHERSHNHELDERRQSEHRMHACQSYEAGHACDSHTYLSVTRCTTLGRQPAFAVTTRVSINQRAAHRGELAPHKLQQADRVVGDGLRSADEDKGACASNVGKSQLACAVGLHQNTHSRARERVERVPARVQRVHKSSSRFG